jgi:hypothetical protein
MHMKNTHRLGFIQGAALLALLGGAACDDEDAASESGSAAEHEHDDSKSDAGAKSDDAKSDAGAKATDDDAKADAGSGETTSEDDKQAGKSWFVVPSQVYSADFADATSYIPIVPSLDVEEISLDKAREVNGRASIGAVGKWLFIAASTQPVVERFEVLADGSLKADGSLNFMNYGVPEFFSIDAWGAVFVDAEKAYIFNGSDGSHIVWNPTTLEITGEIAGPAVTKEGYNLESIAVVRGKRMYRLFTLLNYDSWEFLPEPQYLAVYDLDKDEIIDVVEESRCPQLYSRPFIDENDDIYFSGWVWTPGLALTSDYPKSCALRVKKGEDAFDPDWQLNFAADVTDGREAGILRYLGKGKALLDVFHAERTEIKADTDAEELSSTPNWRLWTVDLEAKTGAPMEGFDFKAGGYTDITVDGRNFLMMPNDDYSETTTYEIVDDKPVKVFKIRGSSYDMRKLR